MIQFNDPVPLALRQYQLDAVEQVRARIRDGAKNVLLCSPTGSGKTRIGAYLIHESDRKFKRSAFVADRTVLINQTSEVFDMHGISHGVIQASHPRCEPWRRVQVASAQTVARREWPETELLIIDEAHTIIKAVSNRISRRDCVTVGLSATPFTRGLGKIYDALVNVTTTNKLIDDGFLSPFQIFAAVEPDMEGVKVIAGEWEEKETAKRALAVVGDVVAEYLKHGEERKFLCSAVDVAHAEELAAQFNAAGIRTFAYSYRTSDDERAQIMRDFRLADSMFRGLISPVALTKGVDVPDVSCLIMARPLRKSLAEHIQFFGRGLRIHPSKTNCKVLDHSGNSLRFWTEWNEFFEAGCTELDDGKPKPKPKKNEDESNKGIKCQQCKHLYPPGLFRCPHCGHERPRKPAVEHVPGILKELMTGGVALTDAEANLYQQLCGHARERNPADLEKASRTAFAMFKDWTGKRPRGRFEDTPSAPLTRAVFNRIRSDRIRWAKGRAQRQSGAASA